MQRKKLSSNDIGILFLLAAIIFGTWFRINPPQTAGLPINDGALFFKQIIDSHNCANRMFSRDSQPGRISLQKFH